MTSLFHRIWFGDKAPPAHYEQYWAAWQRQYPDCEFITWTDADIDKLPLTRDKLRTYTKHASRADLARYEILHQRGGIYIDCDVMPWNHMPADMLTARLTVCNETEATEYCSNSFIAAPPEHPVFLDVINHILKADADESRPNVTTGPWLFGAYVNQHPHKKLPTRTFYPYLYDEPFSTIRTRSLEDTVGVHIWGGSWLEPDLLKSKAFELIEKGDLIDATAILAEFQDEWADDVRVLIDTIRTIRADSAQVAFVLNKDMSIRREDHNIFEFGKVAHWLLGESPDRMVWQIGAADGKLVDPLRPAMINYDPPAMLLEPNPYMFAQLQKGYANNRNAHLLQLAYSLDSAELVLNAINPEKAEQLSLPAWVKGISSVYEDKNPLSGKSIDERTTQLIQSCVERISVSVIGFDDLLHKAGGRHPDILVVDAEGMDKPIIDDIMAHGSLPMIIHFEIQWLEEEEQKGLLDAMADNYVVLQFGNDMTAYRNDVIFEYARSLYVDNGIPTIFREGLNRLNGLN